MKRAAALAIVLMVTGCGGADAPSDAGSASAAIQATPTTPATPAPQTPYPGTVFTPEPTSRSVESCRAEIEHVVNWLDILPRTNPDSLSDVVLQELSYETDNLGDCLATPVFAAYLAANVKVLEALRDETDIADPLAQLLATRDPLASAIGVAALPTAAPVKPVTVKGSGSKNTKPFKLAAGDYDVTIKGTSKSTYGGNVIVHLVNRGDELDTEYLTNEIKGGKGKYKYSTSVYGVAGGSYYLEVTMPKGSWSVTFTPLGS